MKQTVTKYKGMTTYLVREGFTDEVTLYRDLKAEVPAGQEDILEIIRNDPEMIVR